MNIHNTNYVGATGLYPTVDERTITANIIYTSNDLIRLIGNTSNNLIGYDVYNSNALVNYIVYNSNALVNYIVYTSNEIITSLPMSPDTYQPTVDLPPLHIARNWDKNDFFNPGALAIMNSSFYYWRNDFNSISGDIRQHIKLLQEAIEAHEYRFCENDISAWNWELYNNAISLKLNESIKLIELWLLGLTGATTFTLSRTLDSTLSSLLTKTDPNDSNKSLSLNLLNDCDIFYIFSYGTDNNTITSNFGSTAFNGILYNPNNQITSIASPHFDKSYNYINSSTPNNYISISTNILGYRMIKWKNAFSISVNIKLTGYTTIPFIKVYNNSHTFIDIGYETLSSQTYIYFKLRNYNGLILCNYSINYNMALNTWYNITIIYSNTFSLSVYINNVNIYTISSSYIDLVWDSIADNNSLKLQLFYNSKNLNVEYFRLIPKAISSIEVQKIYDMYGSILSLDEIDINQSNYVLSVSNRLTDTTDEISNRLTNTTNEISNRLTNTTNEISNRLTQQFVDLSSEINSAWNSNIETGVIYNTDDKVGIGTDILDDATKLKIVGNTDIQGSLNIDDGGFFVNHNNNNTVPAYSSIQNFLDNYGIIDRFYVVKNNGLYDYKNNEVYNPQSDQINIIYSNELGKYVSRLYNNPKSGFFQPHDLGGMASNRWSIAMNIKFNDNLKEFTICDIYNVSALYATIRAKADFALNRINLYLYTTKMLGQPMELQHNTSAKVSDAKAQHFFVFNIYGFQYTFYVDGVNVFTKYDAQIVLGVYTKVWIGNDYGSHTGSYDYSDVIICDGNNIEPISVMKDIMNYINTLPQKPDNKIFGKTYIEYIVNEQLRLGEYNLVVSSTTTNTNRKMLQIDNDLVENDTQIINSVNNIINNTNNSGFLRYANNSIETAPTLIQQIDYNNDITNKPIIPSSTTQIVEGTNLYYTAERVNAIANAYNLHTSNYVLNSSNDLINYAISKDINVSNYVLRTSNNLINYAISKDINVSNYVLTISNSLINYVISKDINVSNYVLTSSNSLINYVISKDINVSNYVLTSSNSLINYVISKDLNVSNYVLRSSNSLINYVISKDINVSNYVLTSSNSLINYVISKDVNVSNYVLTSSNSLVNYVISKDVNVSNYVLTSSNNLINYTSDKDLNVSNYVLNTSNVISNRISSLGSSPWTVNGTVIYYNNGNVGIGTTFPTVGIRLQVEGTIKGWYFNGSGENLVSLNANNISSGVLSFANGGTGISTIAANLLLGSGNTANTLQAITVGSGLTLSNGTITADAVTSTWGYNGANGNIYYKPSIGPIGATYNVGIGTTNPAYKLDVSGDCRINTTSGYLYAGGLRIAGWDTGNAIYQNTGNLGLTVNTGNNITFSVGNGQEKMKIDSNGNLYANGLRLNGADTGNTIFQGTGALGITGNVANPITFNLFGTDGGEVMKINTTAIYIRKPIICTFGNLALRTIYNQSSDQVQINVNGLNYQGNNSGSWGISSDERIKDNIEIANYELCYSNIQKLDLHRFSYSSNFRDFVDRRQLGFIAQEIEALYPKSIAETSNIMLDGTEMNDCKTVDMSQIHYTLYGAFKHPQSITEQQGKEIERLSRICENLSEYVGRTV